MRAARVAEIVRSMAIRLSDLEGGRLATPESHAVCSHDGMSARIEVSDVRDIDEPRESDPIAPS